MNNNERIYYHKEKEMKTARPYLIILYMIALIVFGAAGDALMITGEKWWGHNLQHLELYGAFFFVVVSVGFSTKRFWKTFLLALLAYTFIRFALFDYFWNWVAEQSWDYVGVTEITDGIKAKVPPHGLAFMRLIVLSAGIGIVFKELR